MTERLVLADTATNRLIGWILGVGSVCTGGLLLWIGSTTFQLAKDSAVQTERLISIQQQQTANVTSASETARSVRELSWRVQRLEDRIARDREADGASGE